MIIGNENPKKTTAMNKPMSLEEYKMNYDSSFEKDSIKSKSVKKRTSFIFIIFNIFSVI
jgi:hypothetical protein